MPSSVSVSSFPFLTFPASLSLHSLSSLSSPPCPPCPPLPHLLSLLPVINAPCQFAGCPPHLFPPCATCTPTRGQNPAPIPSISVHRSAQKWGQRGQGVAPSSTTPAPSGAGAGQCLCICVTLPPANACAFASRCLRPYCPWASQRLPHCAARHFFF